MSRENTARMAWLRDEIRRHDHAYYVLDNPVIADAEYDALMQELRALEAASGDAVPHDSPTRRVGGKADGAFATSFRRCSKPCWAAPVSSIS